MPKHYEALQRAEEERRRKVTGVESPVPAAVPFESAAPPVAPPSARPPGLLSRLFKGRAQPATEEPGEANKRRIALLQPESYVAEQFRTLRALGCDELQGFYISRAVDENAFPQLLKKPG